MNSDDIKLADRRRFLGRLAATIPVVLVGGNAIADGHGEAAKGAMDAAKDTATEAGAEMAAEAGEKIAASAEAAVDSAVGGAGEAAETLNMLTPEDPRYGALGYYPDVASVDPATEKQFKEGSSCLNCAQLKGEPGNEFRPCALFIDLTDTSKMLLVAEKGWCRSWMAMPA